MDPYKPKPPGQNYTISLILHHTCNPLPDQNLAVLCFFSVAIMEGFFAMRLGVTDDGTSGNTFQVSLGDFSSLSSGMVYTWVRSQQATYTQILTSCSEGAGGTRKGE